MSTYEISKSSLLSLKAEILRKQQELSKVQAGNDVKIRNLKKNTPLEIKNKGVEERRKNDMTEEEEDLLKKSRKILEAKSKIYDQLNNKSKKLTEDEAEVSKRYLVHFDKKRSRLPDLPPDEPDDEDKYPESEDDYPHEQYDNAENPDDEWVEYLDCLGRTRTCLRKDLLHLKANDAELNETHQKRKANTKPSTMEEDKHAESEEEEVKEKLNEKEITEEIELLSVDMRRELLRQQWEKEEETLRDKDNIHYQDILFNEARSHGVGYYGFSKDEKERAAQQEALNKIRKETEAQQKKAQDMKALREKQLASRILAAKNRRRARLGLPPEEEAPEPAKSESSDEQLKKAEIKSAKELEIEKLLDATRKTHVRPWDVGKQGLKEHYVYSQEEWMDKQRNERKDEFAPPSSYRKSFRGEIDKHYSDDNEKTLRFSSKKPTDSPKKSINPYKRRNNYEEIEQSKQVEPTPIDNEVDEYTDRLMQDFRATQNNYRSESSSDTEDERRGKYAEFEPPPTYDYYGPSSSKKNRTSGGMKPHISDSIEAGLKFLRKQVEKKGSGERNSDMFLS